MSDTQSDFPRILVVDDDPNLLLLLEKMLMRIDTSPTLLDSGTKGWELLQKEAFDLVILDLMLPDVDGFEILKRIREKSEFDEMPVLILSALADPDTISNGLELGADGYLTKPYLPNTLTSRVKALLERGRRKSE